MPLGPGGGWGAGAPPGAATVDLVEFAELTSSVAVQLAHQGGWDEIALVAGPLVLLFGLLVLANRRARRTDED